MKIELILGRPGAGKTERLINCVNASLDSPLMVSLENHPEMPRDRGLKDAIALYSPDRPELLKIEDILDEIGKARACNVAIENLELLPRQIELCVLTDALEEAGVEHLVLSSHLRRDVVWHVRQQIYN
jgi:hypothetical protein